MIRERADFVCVSLLFFFCHDFTNIDYLPLRMHYFNTKTVVIDISVTRCYFCFSKHPREIRQICSVSTCKVLEQITRAYYAVHSQVLLRSRNTFREDKHRLRSDSVGCMMSVLSFDRKDQKHRVRSYRRAHVERVRYAPYSYQTRVGPDRELTWFSYHTPPHRTLCHVYDGHVER